MAKPSKAINGVRKIISVLGGFGFLCTQACQKVNFAAHASLGNSLLDFDQFRLCLSQEINVSGNAPFPFALQIMSDLLAHCRGYIGRKVHLSRSLRAPQEEPRPRI
jgi:hypothetical protein